MNCMMARHTEGDQIFGRIITESTPWLNVVHLKALHAPAQLTTPAVSIEDLAAELAISLGIKPQSWPLGTHSGHSVT